MAPRTLNTAGGGGLAVEKLRASSFSEWRRSMMILA
jgi:hypothetical protein